VSEEKDFDAKKFSDTLHDQIHSEIHSSVSEKMDRTESATTRSWAAFTWAAEQQRTLLGSFSSSWSCPPPRPHGVRLRRRLWRFWPLLLVCAGIPNVMSRERRLWGILLIAGGMLFQLDELGLAHFRWNDIWPILLIATGLMLMWGA